MFQRRGHDGVSNACCISIGSSATGLPKASIYSFPCMRSK